MSILLDILSRNLGNTLTPELARGILLTVDEAPLFAASTTLEPAEPDCAGLVTDRERVGAWVAERVGQLVPWGGYAAIGYEDGDGQIIAGVVLNNMTPTNATIHLALASRYAFRRVFIRSVFDYAFRQLGLRRLTALINADNADSLRLCRHLGFVDEFMMPEGNVGGLHFLVLWKEQCRWLGGSDGR
jgi:RimJ/RimL family protein N-acetyltransferase